MQISSLKSVRSLLALSLTLILVLSSIVLLFNQSQTAEAANVTYGNLGAPDSTAAVCMNQACYGATGFTVPAGQDYALVSLTVKVDVSTAGNLTLKLYQDNAGQPGAEITSVATQSVGVGNNQNITFTPAGTLVLTAGSTYWFASVPDASYDGLWHTSLSTAPGGGGFTPTANVRAYTFDNGATWPNTYTTEYPVFELIVGDVPAQTSSQIASFNPQDNRLNRSPGDAAAPVAIYQGSVDIYGIDPSTSQGVLEIRVTDEEIEAAGIPSVEQGSLLLAEDQNRATGMPIEVYRLSSGEFQVNTYYASGKPYIFRWYPDRPYEGVHIAW